MFKRFSGVIIVVSCIFFAIGAYAETEGASASKSIPAGMGDKLRRGLINTFTGWYELPHQIVKGFNDGFMGEEENKLFGILLGSLKGISCGIGRTASGVADLVFFWAADPKDNIYVGMPLDAEYAWEEGVSYDIFDPNITEAAIRPMVNKLFRGAGNTLFAFMEVPMQVKKGFSKGAWDLGISKGLWFWASREVSGVVDLFTIPCANPEYTAGVTLDDDMPWEIYLERKNPALMQ
ncbi:MAG: exosortase system-associated protein, TIGR04073 family [Candidatus Omnitrophica bacterium]|nr:exosortase system-associated protein, TIGR04073 family [Candidatus Omnitrophota bacterium]